MALHNGAARAKAWLQNLSVLLLAVALPVGLSELALRWIYEEPWYDQLIDEQFSGEKIEYTKNRFELRDRDYPSRSLRATCAS
ncbi:MAG: hypothetical protein OEM05_05510 [Myxococcales bacterium]|nr:hypothetical protein [Myxococcales bacterium]